MITTYAYRNLKLTPEAKNEVFNIREGKSSKQLTIEVIDFYARPYSEFCHYCYFENKVVIVDIPAKIVKNNVNWSRQ